ncbi:MAG: serine/threonine protein kinase [Bacillota bacterium]
MDNLIHLIENQLLKQVRLESIYKNDPIVVSNIPEGWHLLGNGNYAGVFYHEEFPQYAVKVYAKGREGIEEEKLVYKMIGKHESFSECYHYGSTYLILKRLKVTSLYDCMKKGIFIPEKIIEDISEAIEYARSRGLHPHDIHFKNVGIQDGKGIIIDVSDFLKTEDCTLWNDCKKFYFKAYKKLPFIVPIPDFSLNMGRKLYRLYKRLKRKNKWITKET